MSDDFQRKWLSDLPTDWSEKRADFLGNPYRITVDPGVYGDELVAHYSIPQVQETGGPYIEPASDIGSTKLLIESPTLLVSKLNPRKRTICIAKPHPQHRTLASSEFVAINCEQMNRRYAYYIWQSEKITDRLSALVQSATRSHQRVNPADILKLPWKWPPLTTQRRIARFLDEKTAKIDGLIEKKRALLDLLAEKRQALITRAVTKGVDLDGHRRDRRGDRRVAEGISGMSYFAHSDERPEWAAQIPEGWDCDWLKWSVDLCTKRPTAEEQEALPYIANEHIASWTGKLLIEEPKPAKADSRTFQQNDVLFNKLRPYLAKVHHATFHGVSSGELLCLRPTHVVESRFLFYVLLSKGFIDTVNAETFGAKMPRADWEIVGHQPLPLPPLDTQRQIVQFLDEKITQIDGLYELIVQSVDYLEEYRSALITATVTGQTGELNGD